MVRKRLDPDRNLSFSVSYLVQVKNLRYATDLTDTDNEDNAKDSDEDSDEEPDDSNALYASTNRIF